MVVQFFLKFLNSSVDDDFFCPRWQRWIRTFTDLKDHCPYMYGRRKHMGATLTAAEYDVQHCRICRLCFHWSNLEMWAQKSANCAAIVFLKCQKWMINGMLIWIFASLLLFEFVYWIIFSNFRAVYNILCCVWVVWVLYFVRCPSRMSHSWP